MREASFDDIVARIEAFKAPGLIGIDGLPCSGKSTLAEKLEQRFGIETIYLDDFVLPEASWPEAIKPAFPFEYMRYDAFVAAVRDLAQTGEAHYRRFDWETMDLSAEERTVLLDRPVIVEGVSALSEELAPLLALSIFVESDADSVLETALRRGVGPWERQWRELFLPSVELYMHSDPKSRADVIYAGRME